MIDYSDDIFEEEEGKTYTEQEKNEIILKRILKSKLKTIRRIKNLGSLYRTIIKEIYDADPISGVQFMKTFDIIPDLRNLPFITSPELLAEKYEEIKFITSVVYSLNFLNDDEKDIIWKSFFYSCKKKDSKKYYSNSTFYRLRSKASHDLVALTNDDYLRLLRKRELIK